MTTYQKKEKIKIVRQTTLQKQREEKKAGKKQKPRPKKSPRKKKIEKPSLEILSSYFSMISKNRPGGGALTQQTEAATTSDMGNQLHEYLSDAIDNLLIEGVKKLGIEPPPELPALISETESEELILKKYQEDLNKVDVSSIRAQKSIKGASKSIERDKIELQVIDREDEDRL